ncbi:transcriptional regulator, partial [Streptococcus pneumoniae]
RLAPGVYQDQVVAYCREKGILLEAWAEIANYFNVSTDYLLGRTDNPAIAGSDEFAQVNGQIIDLRKAAANTMLFDGKPLNEDDIDFITSVLSAHFKSKGER